MNAYRERERSRNYERIQETIAVRCRADRRTMRPVDPAARLRGRLLKGENFDMCGRPPATIRNLLKTAFFHDFSIPMAGLCTFISFAAFTPIVRYRIWTSNAIRRRVPFYVWRPARHSIAFTTILCRSAKDTLTPYSRPLSSARIRVCLLHSASRRNPFSQSNTVCRPSRRE